jgi:hypothetical protein
VRLYQDAGDLRGDVQLQIDHAASTELLAEATGPEILMIHRPQQRDADLDLALHPVDAALQHVVDARVRDGVVQSLLGWKAKAGIGTEDEDIFEENQCADHRLSGAPGIDVLRRIAAVIFKRQNQEGWPLFCGCSGRFWSTVLDRNQPPQQSAGQQDQEEKETCQKARPLLK